MRTCDRAIDLTYPLRTAARLTGLSPEILRAWERRYGVVVPKRTPGGTRRYSAADLERLRRVKAAVDAGMRIGKVARMSPDEIERLSSAKDASEGGQLEEVLRALDALDGAEVQRLLALQLSGLGPLRFASGFALPLVHVIGSRWAEGRLGIASEHLASGVLRSLLGAALQPSSASLRGPRIVFATPSGERHELGLLMAALTALGSGANPLYLGAEVPDEELLSAVERTDAAALALGIVALPHTQVERSVHALRDGIEPAVGLWLGGAGASNLELPQRVEHIASLDAFERRVALLVASDSHPG